MEQSKIWEAFQNDKSLLDSGFPARKRFEFIARHIPASALALNIGVGNGYLENLLVQKGVRVHCLDPSDSAIKKIRRRFDLGNKAQTGYSQSIPFPDASLDYVVMSEVLEHLDDMVIEKTLAEVKRVLKINGGFLGTVPADESIINATVVCPKCGDCFHKWGHVQSFSRESLLDRLSAEFNDVSIRRKLFSDFDQPNWKGKILAVLKKFQAFLNLKGSTQNLFFVARNDVIK